MVCKSFSFSLFHVDKSYYSCCFNVFLPLTLTLGAIWDQKQIDQNEILQRTRQEPVPVLILVGLCSILACHIFRFALFSSRLSCFLFKYKFWIKINTPVKQYQELEILIVVSSVLAISPILHYFPQGFLVSIVVQVEVLCLHHLAYVLASTFL